MEGKTLGEQPIQEGSLVEAAFLEEGFLELLGVLVGTGDLPVEDCEHLPLAQLVLELLLLERQPLVGLPQLRKGRLLLLELV